MPDTEVESKLAEMREEVAYCRSLKEGSTKIVGSGAVIMLIQGFADQIEEYLKFAEALKYERDTYRSLLESANKRMERFRDFASYSDPVPMKDMIKEGEGEGTNKRETKDAEEAIRKVARFDEHSKREMTGETGEIVLGGTGE